MKFLIISETASIRSNMTLQTQINITTMHKLVVQHFVVSYLTEILSFAPILAIQEQFYIHTINRIKKIMKINYLES